MWMEGSLRGQPLFPTNKWHPAGTRFLSINSPRPLSSRRQNYEFSHATRWPYQQYCLYHKKKHKSAHAVFLSLVDTHITHETWLSWAILSSRVQPGETAWSTEQHDISQRGMIMMLFRQQSRWCHRVHMLTHSHSQRVKKTAAWSVAFSFIQSCLWATKHPILIRKTTTWVSCESRLSQPI